MLSALDFQILQFQIDNAVASGLLYNKQAALERYFIRIGAIRYKHDSMFRGEAFACGTCASIERYSVYVLTTDVVDMHIRVASRLIAEELSQRAYELSMYDRAEKSIFVPNPSFTPSQILHTNSVNQELTVDQLLKVSKYSIAVAEILQPNDPNIELASAAITVFQGIEASLNNQQQPISIGKKLHLANGFLSTVIKSQIKDADTKRGITITSTMIDLVIDFFCGR